MIKSIYWGNMDMNIDQQHVQQYKILFEKVVELVSSIKFTVTNDEQKLLHIFLFRQASLLKAIKALADTKLYYEGCILLTTLIENYILQKWLIRNNKVVDYVEFGAVESFPRLAFFPEEKAELLQFIEEHNVKRFLRKQKNGMDLLDKRNYQAEWRNLTNMVNDLSKYDDKSEVKRLKHSYDLACGYKHSNSYAVLARMTSVVNQDAIILYKESIFVSICNLFLIDICCSIQGLKEQIKALYIELGNISKSDYTSIFASEK